VIRSFALTFASWGGTNFHRANLSDTNLQGARLKNCNFYKATLTRANFRHAQKLDRARPGESLLQNWLMLDLLPWKGLPGRGRNSAYPCRPMTFKTLTI